MTSGSPVILASRCTLCGEDVDITGYLAHSTDSDGSSSLVFTSDDAGTQTAWEHQAMHELEENEDA